MTTRAGEGPVLVAMMGMALVNRVMPSKEYWPELRAGCRVAAQFPHRAGAWNYLHLTELGQG